MHKTLIPHSGVSEGLPGVLRNATLNTSALPGWGAYKSHRFTENKQNIKKGRLQPKQTSKCGGEPSSISSLHYDYVYVNIHSINNL